MMGYAVAKSAFILGISIRKIAILSLIHFKILKPKSDVY